MPPRVDLYDHAYGQYQLDVYTQIRLETYGEDLGQTSWVTIQEANEIPRLLEITARSQVLEIGCGSGRYALRLAEQTRCRVLGLDVNPLGIRNAKEMALRAHLESLVRFEECDVARPLPFEEETFEAVFANDVLCHIADRLSVLREFRRVLKPGGRLLFSDALVIGGLVTKEELAIRSAIGFYVFSPPGCNEELIQRAGLRLLSATNTTENAAQIATQWHHARQRRKEDLTATEGRDNFEELQRFLSCTHTLARERRLLRWLYVARKDAQG
jgi:ubiquinone/menaquinone biosynthesis C-methylase UbiE